MSATASLIEEASPFLAAVVTTHLYRATLEDTEASIRCFERARWDAARLSVEALSVSGRKALVLLTVSGDSTDAA